MGYLSAAIQKRGSSCAWLLISSLVFLTGCEKTLERRPCPRSHRRAGVFEHNAAFRYSVFLTLAYAHVSLAALL